MTNAQSREPTRPHYGKTYHIETEEGETHKILIPSMYVTYMGEKVIKAEPYEDPDDTGEWDSKKYMYKVTDQLGHVADLTNYHFSDFIVYDEDTETYWVDQYDEELADDDIPMAHTPWEGAKVMEEYLQLLSQLKLVAEGNLPEALARQMSEEITMYFNRHGNLPTRSLEDEHHYLFTWTLPIPSEVLALEQTPLTTEHWGDYKI